MKQYGNQVRQQRAKLAAEQSHADTAPTDADFSALPRPSSVPATPKLIPFLPPRITPTHIKEMTRSELDDSFSRPFVTKLDKPTLVQQHSLDAGLVESDHSHHPSPSMGMEKEKRIESLRLAAIKLQHRLAVISETTKQIQMSQLSRVSTPSPSPKSPPPRVDSKVSEPTPATAKSMYWAIPNTALRKILAAISIQRVFRGHMARTRFRHLQQHRLEMKEADDTSFIKNLSHSLKHSTDIPTPPPRLTGQRISFHDEPNITNDKLSIVNMLAQQLLGRSVWAQEQATSSVVSQSTTVDAKKTATAPPSIVTVPDTSQY